MTLDEARELIEAIPCLRCRLRRSATAHSINGYQNKPGCWFVLDREALAAAIVRVSTPREAEVR